MRKNQYFLEVSMNLIDFYRKLPGSLKQTFVCDAFNFYSLFLVT